MQTFLITLGVFLLLVIIAYIIAFRDDILVSELGTAQDEVEAEQYYYLPKAQLTLSVTALIQIERSLTDKAITSHQLLQLNFNPAVTIIPDSQAFVQVKYKGNWFFADDLQITTSAAALLENVSATTEDRLGPIVAQITQAPVGAGAQNLMDLRLVAAKPAPKSITEIIEVSNVFTVTEDELALTELTKNWPIALEGLHTPNLGTVDASFTLKNAHPLIATNAAAKSVYNGLLTRRLVAQQWTIENNDTGTTSFTCLVPDTASLLKIPVRRYPFIKSLQLPKFQQGLLISNTITKPSQVEGLAAIPINIAKAILAIPAQLLQFKIAHIHQETDYQKSLNELSKARQTGTEKSNGDALKRISDQLEAIKKKQNIDTGVAVPDEQAADEPVPQLGKLPAKPSPEIEGMKRMELFELKEGDDDAPVFAAPLAWNWAKGITDWDEYDNIKSKTCVPAAAAHLLLCWTFNAKLPVKKISVEVVKDTLKEVAPSHDVNKGCDMLSFMAYWSNDGLGGDIINQYIPLKIKDIELLKKAVYFFGGCMIGLQMPKSAIGKNRWDYPSAEPEKDGLDWGGHAVCVVGFSGNDFTVISWGKVIIMSAAFYKKYNDESYVALSVTDWVTAKDKSPTKEQLNAAALNDLLTQLYNA
jgi:hypothetical protein